MARPRGNEEDPRALLPDGLTLAEFTDAVEEAETIVDVQQATRLPRSTIKRLLWLLDGEYDLTSAASAVETLRRED
ncbi:MAG: hypothetical protein ABEH77_07330 [Halobacteriaceae archaeon]